jgi:aconitate hydratase
MGVLPLQYTEGESAESLGLSGHEAFDIAGLAGLEPGKRLTVKATSDDGEEKEFKVKARVDSPVEVEYLRNGGILQTVLRQMLEEDD